MRNLTRSIMNFLCLTGNSMTLDLPAALASYSVPEARLQEQGWRINDARRFRMPQVKPVSADLRWWFSEQWHDGVLDQKMAELTDEERTIALLPVIGAKKPPALYEPVEGVELIEEWSGEPVRYVNSGYPGHKHHVTVKTPFGTLTGCEEYAERSFAIVEYPVKSVEDLAIVRYIYQQRARYASLDKCTGPAPMSPMQVLLVQLAGVENTAFMMADDPETVEEFLDFLESLFAPAIDAFTRGGRLAITVENFDANISTGYYDKYIAPVFRNRSRIASKNGGLLGIHHDGKLMPMLSRHAANGIHLINGLTAAPSGDLDICDMRKVIGEGVVMVDMVPQAIFMPEFKEIDFENFIERAAAHYRDDAGVIFGIGDMLPVCSDIRRYIKMVQIVEEVTKR